MVTYETIYLTLTPEEAAQIISRQVSHLRRRQDGKTIEFRLNSGLHLATLSEATLASGRQGAKLRYRSSMIRPHFLYARNTAHQIRDVVEEYRTTPATR